jgi:hypothetical protein
MVSGFLIPSKTHPVLLSVVSLETFKKNSTRFFIGLNKTRSLDLVSPYHIHLLKKREISKRVGDFFHSIYHSNRRINNYLFLYSLT